MWAAMKYDRDVVIRYFRESEEAMDARVKAGIEANRKGDATLGKPIQITETTIPAFSEDPGDEAVQAELLRKLYSIWFSHPAMEAIIYWDMSDAYTWLRTMRGSLCRRDMSPKPAYNAVRDLFGREWRTDMECEAPGGRLPFRGFCGTYEVEAVSNGRTVKHEFHVGRGSGEQKICLIV